MSASVAVAVAALFTWLGMVLGISFLEAPLKFNAPGVTVRIGLGIGRIVFRALNIAEALLATTVVAALTLEMIAGAPLSGTMVVAGVAVLILLVQLLVVRPRLNRRSDRVLAGEDPPRSRAHHVYVVLETLKVVAIAAAGVLLLAA